MRRKVCVETIEKGNTVQFHLDKCVCVCSCVFKIYSVWPILCRNSLYIILSIGIKFMFNKFADNENSQLYVSWEELLLSTALTDRRSNKIECSNCTQDWTTDLRTTYVCTGAYFPNAPCNMTRISIWYFDNKKNFVLYFYVIVRKTNSMISRRCLPNSELVLCCHLYESHSLLGLTDLRKMYSNYFSSNANWCKWKFKALFQLQGTHVDATSNNIYNCFL